jgi:dTDP-4-dehydrorhamnose reductase
MDKTSVKPHRHALELWAGLECTINRVGDHYFSQMEKSGHLQRDDDIARFASLGIKAIRYPVLWEHIAPHGLEQADWRWPDRQLAALEAHGVAPIVGLIHHGSGPRHTSLVAPQFATELAAFAQAVARRYPQLERYTPVNEPLTTARFSGMYGLWYPHGRDERTFVQALLNQCRAVVLSMRAIRAVNPQAQLVQTEDLGQTYATLAMADVAAFYNERRWLSWDLLCGRVGPSHALWQYLLGTGIDRGELQWLQDNPCPPDVIGINYYITSERLLDHRIERYPERYHGHAGGRRCADIEVARALAQPTAGIGPLLQAAWQRYGVPLAVTEVHIDATREDQLRWMLEIWNACEQARTEGVDVRAATVWALLGSFDWNRLVTASNGYYEPGPFDVRSATPRPTALAGLARELAGGRAPSHPVLAGQGWWRRPHRFLCPPVAIAGNAPLPCVPPAVPAGPEVEPPAPILIAGAHGTLGQAFARICQQRHLAYVLLPRAEMDIADAASVERALRRLRPWAVINAAGYVRVDAAESDPARCHRANALGPAVLGAACARHGIGLLTFSSDLVFSGEQSRPYVESDQVAPLNIYGYCKAAGEAGVFESHPQALVVRSSAFFGPWDQANFVCQAIDTLAAGAPLLAANDVVVSPTYVPDLVHACLDLLVDGEQGIWHLSNGSALSWANVAHKAATAAGVDTSRLEAKPAAHCSYVAPRPPYSALGTERAIVLPGLDDAISRFLAQRRPAPGRQAMQLHGRSGL